MAGKVSAKNAVITLTDPTVARTISTSVRSFTINESSGMVDVTGFTDGGQNFVPGLPVHDVTLDLIYDSTASTGVMTVLRAIRTAGTACTLTIKPETTGLTLTFVCFPDSIPVTATPAGSLDIGSVKFVQMGSTAGSWA